MCRDDVLIVFTPIAGRNDVHIVFTIATDIRPRKIVIDKTLKKKLGKKRGECVYYLDIIDKFALTMDAIKNIGAIDVWIDDFTPCLKDNLTGEVVNTEVIRIRRKSFLKKFNRKNGWYVNWGNVVEDCEVKEYLANDYEPVDETSMPYIVDIRAIKAYADSKGISIVSLTDEEKKQFLIPNPHYRKKGLQNIAAVL